MYDLLIKNGKIVTAESVTEGNISKEGENQCSSYQRRRTRS